MKISMSTVVPLLNHDFAIYRLLESRIFLVLVGCKGVFIARTCLHDGYAPI